MKLFYSPGACSLSPHIVAREAGLPIELIKTSLADKKTEDGRSLTDLNPKGYVPYLVLDNGQALTEGPAIVQYLADLAPQAKLAPVAGSFERVRLQEWLNYISTEIHKTFSILFNPKMPDEAKALAKDRLKMRYAFVNDKLADRDWLLGEFSVADAYLFVCTNWAGMVGLDLADFERVLAHRKRMQARPAVQEAMRAEGLLK